MAFWLTPKRRQKLKERSLLLSMSNITRDTQKHLENDRDSTQLEAIMRECDNECYRHLEYGEIRGWNDQKV